VPRHRVGLGALLALTFLACGAAALFFALPLLQAPYVAAVEPADGARDILPTAPIIITFSAPMNRDAAQAALRLSPRVNGSWAWRDDRTLVFTPRATLPISKTLTLQISTDARSQFGAALAQAVRARFTTLTYPHVVASDPARDAQFSYSPTQVTFTFNRAMNADALRANLIVTPTLANATLAVNGTTVTLGGFFEPRTRYEIRLDAAATDAAYKLPLERAAQWSFITATQYPNFSILNRGRVLEFSTNTPVEIPVQFTNVSRLDLAVYPLTPPEFDANASAAFETWYAFKPSRAPVQKQVVPTNAQLDRYTQTKIALEPLPRGVYYLKITTPEGPTDAQLVRVK